MNVIDLDAATADNDANDEDANDEDANDKDTNNDYHSTFMRTASIADEDCHSNVDAPSLAESILARQTDCIWFMGIILDIIVLSAPLLIL